MSREVHVRFWESVEVRFLRATQLGLPSERPVICPARSPPRFEFDDELGDSDFGDPDFDVNVN